MATKRFFVFGINIANHHTSISLTEGDHFCCEMNSAFSRCLLAGVGLISVGNLDRYLGGLVVHLVSPLKTPNIAPHEKVRFFSMFG